MGVEGFEDVAGEQGVVDAAVFVVFKVGEFVLSNVDHFGGLELWDGIWREGWKEGGCEMRGKWCGGAVLLVFVATRKSLDETRCQDQRHFSHSGFGMLKHETISITGLRIKISNR